VGIVRIQSEPIDMDALVRAVEDPGAGALVTFAGTTRNETHGKAVVSLTYEAYREMAEPKLAEIADTARTRFEIVRIAIVHRIARLGIGEVSVGIAVSAAHRPAAFEACRFAIEAVKHDVPIWKREIFADGTEEWVHPGEC
jgi:molybdopterin synthase catalytic subunit